MKRILSLSISLCALAVVAQDRDLNPSPYMRQVLRAQDSAAARAALEVSAGGATNGIQMLGGFGTNTTLRGNTSIDNISATNIAANVANVFNVQRFGAVGDDSADDTAPIQAAIHAASAVRGTVHLPRPAVKYLVTGTLYVTNKVTITGDPDWVNAEAAPYIRFTGHTLFALTNNRAAGVRFVGIPAHGTNRVGSQVFAAINPPTGQVVVGTVFEDCLWKDFGTGVVLTNAVRTEFRRGSGYARDGVTFGLRSGEYGHTVMDSFAPTSGSLADKPFEFFGGMHDIRGLDQNSSNTVMAIRGNAGVLLTQPNVEGTVPLGAINVGEGALWQIGGRYGQDAASYSLIVSNDSHAHLIGAGMGVGIPGYAHQILSTAAAFAHLTYYPRGAAKLPWFTNAVTGLWYPVFDDASIEIQNSGLVGTLTGTDASTNHWGVKWRSVWAGRDRIYEYIMKSRIGGDPKFLLFDRNQYAWDRFVDGLAPVTTSNNTFTASNYFSNATIAGMNRAPADHLVVGAGNSISWSKLFLNDDASPMITWGVGAYSGTARTVGKLGTATASAFAMGDVASGDSILVAPAGSPWRIGTSIDTSTEPLTRLIIGANGTVTVSTNFVIASPSIPATSGAAGVKGQVAYDSDYIYICTAANTWKRVAISTW